MELNRPQHKGPQNLKLLTFIPAFLFGHADAFSPIIYLSRFTAAVWYKGFICRKMCYSFNHVCIKGAKDVNGMKYYTKAHLFCESTNLAVYVLWDVWLPNQTLPTRVILTPWGTHATLWAGQHDVTSYLNLHFVWIYRHAIRYCGFGANIFWNGRKTYGVKNVRDKTNFQIINYISISMAY